MAKPPKIVGEYEVVDAARLREHPRNPNLGDDPVVRELIRRHGFRGTIEVQRSTGYITAGNTRYRSGVAEGMPQFPVTWTDDDDETALERVLADNRARDLAMYDDQLVAEILAERVATPAGLEGTGWDQAAFDDLVARITGSDEPPERTGDGDTPPEPETTQRKGDPTTQRGDVWTLGPHRLVCVATFDAAARGRLLDGELVKAVITDPPYAIFGSSSGVHSSVADDAMVRPFFEALGRALREVTTEFGHVYVCCDWRSYATLWDSFKVAELTPKNCLVWDKGSQGMGSMWANTHEFVAFFVNEPPAKTMMSGRPVGNRLVTAGNILRYPRVMGPEREHNAAKPVAMLAQIIGNCTDEGDTIADLFGGSGSTLIAAHDTGRICRMMEKSPPWCDTIVARWQRHTGETAYRGDQPVTPEHWTD